MTATECTYKLRDCILATKEWGPKDGIPTLACHGWLDNASTFDGIAPLLPHHRLIAVDFAGHGLSAHRQQGPLYQIVDLVWDIVALIEHLEFQQCSIIGHSLGAVVGSLVAASFPERLKQLVCIDALGPLTMEAHRAPQQLRIALLKHAELHNKKPPTYASIEEALMVRAMHGGIAPEALRSMTLRGIKQTSDGRYTWRTDPQLLNPTAVMMTEELALSYLRAISTPTLLMRPEEGLEFPPSILEGRISAVKNIRVEIMKGHHHQHLETPEPFAKLIRDFME